MKVLSIDPGERVGWAHGDIEPRSTSKWVPEGYDKELVVTGHGITALKPFALKLAEVFPTYDVVVYERFALAGGKAKEQIGSEFPTVQLIGVIRYLSWIHPGTKLVGQWPANMRTAEHFTPTFLPEVQTILDRLPKAHDDSHDGSALLHLGYYFWKRYV